MKISNTKRENFPDNLIHLGFQNLCSICHRGWIAVFNSSRKADIDLLESVQNSFTMELMRRCVSRDDNLTTNGSQRSDFFILPLQKNRRKTAYIIIMNVSRGYHSIRHISLMECWQSVRSGKAHTLGVD